MKKLVLLIAVIAGLGFAQPAQAAYTYQAECQTALSGSPPGTDNEVWDTIVRENTYHFGGPSNVVNWYWGYFNRYSANYMRQDWYLVKASWDLGADVIHVVGYCNDTNASGQVSSSEDEWAAMFPE